MPNSILPSRTIIDNLNVRSSMRTQLFLIALAAILPSALVLWFMSLAIQNEQLVRQQIQAEALQAGFDSIRFKLVSRWKNHLNRIDGLIEQLPPPTAFAHTVLGQLADGLVIAEKNNKTQILYPNRPRHLNESTQRQNWLPELDAKFKRLREAYKMGDFKSANRLAKEIVSIPDAESVTDRSGRHVLINIKLYVLSHTKLMDDNEHNAIRDGLVQQLNDYDFTELTAAQRRFTMQQLIEIDDAIGRVDFPTLKAEQLVARLVQSISRGQTDSVLSPTPISSLWQIGLPSGRGIAIFNENTVSNLFLHWIDSIEIPVGTNISLLPPSNINGRNVNGHIRLAFHNSFPGWVLQGSLDGGANGSGSVTKIYVITSAFVVIFIIATLFFVARLTMQKMQLAQQKNTMVATVSHELRTPVSSIQLLVDNLLRRDNFNSKRAKEYLQLIAKENTRLSQLIENFLSFSRIERQQFKLIKEPIDLNELVDEVVSNFRHQSDITDEEFVVDRAPELPNFYGDYWAIARVLLNLLDNAYKYSDPPRKLSLRVFTTTWNLVLIIEDNGIGIDQKDQEKIFRQFFQADQKLSRTAEGCGLGLCIVQHIVQLHGGRIDLKSKVGAGSTFTVTLPLRSET